MINPRISLIIGLISISIFPVLVKWAPVSGITSAFYRMFIGFICLLPYAVIGGKLQVTSWKQWIPITICGILFGTDIAVWNLSIHYSNATQATLLTNLSPVWVGIGSFLFLPYKPSARFWIGTALAMVGLVVLFGLDTFTGMQFDKGFTFAILSGILYATYMIVSKSILNKINIITFMTYSMAVSSIYLFAVCLFTDQPLWHFSTTIWSVFIVQGLISQLLGWLAISYAVQMLDAERVSLSLLGQSVVTGLLAWLFIGEKISLQMIIGGLIILTGIAITFKKEKPAEV
jgi:drug/metabolite transporter (DMT)-like permease